MVGGGGSRLLSLLPKAEYDGFERRERERGKLWKNGGGGRSAAALLLLAFWHMEPTLSLSLSFSASLVLLSVLTGSGAAAAEAQARGFTTKVV